MISSLFFLVYILIQACCFLFPNSKLSFSLFFQNFLKTIGMSQITLGRIQIEVYEMLWATFKLWSSACPTSSVTLDFTVGERKVAWVKRALCKIFHKTPCTIKWQCSYAVFLTMQWLLCLMDISNIWEEEAPCKRLMLEFHVWELITSHRLIIHNKNLIHRIYLSVHGLFLNKLILSNVFII